MTGTPSIGKKIADFIFYFLKFNDRSINQPSGGGGNVRPDDARVAIAQHLCQSRNKPHQMGVCGKAGMELMRSWSVVERCNSVLF